VLKVTHKGEKADITVPPEVPVVAFVPGDMSLVKLGAPIFIFGCRSPNDSVAATRAALKKDGGQADNVTGTARVPAWGLRHCCPDVLHRRRSAGRSPQRLCVWYGILHNRAIHWICGPARA
jgi:hypothetical protein